MREREIRGLSELGTEGCREKNRGWGNTEGIGTREGMGKRKGIE